jgi:hypothetical protein
MDGIDLDSMRTADGVPIVDGLRVWDYNLDRGVVDLSNARRMVQYVPSDGWFDVRLDGGGKSLMNAERVVTRHPVTRETA